MEVFEGVEFVVLRIWQSDLYLHADEDGRSVYHGSLGGGSALQHNVVWAVEELVAVEPHTRYVLLRGAYGRYLGAGAPDARDRERFTCCPLPCCPSLEAAQRDRDEPEVDAIMWHAIGCSGPDVFAGRGARGVVLLHDRSGRYLRGNRSFLTCRHSVSVDGNVENETTLRWEVVPVPWPGLPIATDSNLACSPPLRREIRFVTADDDDGNFGEQDWASFQYTGRSVQLLREELARRVDYDFMLCVRAGRHGRLTPLLINLPRSRETLHIVLVRPKGAADNQLIFPNLSFQTGGGGYAAYYASRVVRALSGPEDLRCPLMPRPDETPTPQTSKPIDPPLPSTGDDQIWNKRQIGYVYVLTTSLAVLFFVRHLLPAGYDGYILAIFAIIWGLGSVGLPCGMFGESRCEKNCSRHVGQTIYATFSVFVIYCIYLLTLHVDKTHLPSSPPPSPLLGHDATGDDSVEFFWRVVYCCIGASVLIGHICSWLRGCYTGADRDPGP
ncbi:hypothetical protein E2562_022259 [Oryza meyeriana var. granulata]|uniref:DUF569 domain-containing protein n=1 Tax=Oryza meyeriana var. granulata TaxID=110450 RepID=A0A6G1D4T4_9ORYZ|nr:hypothetical protein E2562_022259 [Oryza meyeriana var. granulata]